MNKLTIDIVSDLHIEQWDTNIKTKYPCGKVKNKPFIFPHTKSNVLIIAGDISDNIDISLEYINELSKKYQSVLFVDGNHEHTLKYPSLYSLEYIYELTKKYNENIFYLPKSNYKYKDTVFIGVCGWWDYNNKDMKSIQENLNYFSDWIKDFKEDDNLEFINNVIRKSEKEYKHLKYLIDIYNKDEYIKNIIVVSHTIPLFEMLKDSNDKSNKKSNGTNNNFKSLIDNNQKISHWIFGHTHEQIDFTYNNIKFICHPRGRPEDYDREEYKLKSFSI